MPLITPILAPHICGGETSVALQVIADASAITGETHDFAQQEGYPAWSPQRVQLTAETALDVVLVDEDGHTHTISVPAASPLQLGRPIRSITKSGSGAVQVIAEWIDPHGDTAWNPPVVS